MERAERELATVAEDMSGERSDDRVPVTGRGRAGAEREQAVAGPAAQGLEVGLDALRAAGRAGARRAAGGGARRAGVGRRRGGRARRRRRRGAWRDADEAAGGGEVEGADEARVGVSRACLERSGEEAGGARARRRRVGVGEQAQERLHGGAPAGAGDDEVVALGADRAKRRPASRATVAIARPQSARPWRPRGDAAVRAGLVGVAGTGAGARRRAGRRGGRGCRCRGCG